MKQAKLKNFWQNDNEDSESSDSYSSDDFVEES